jgi:tRNA pseudouridine55 synthase
VLPLVIGRATRLSRFLSAAGKSYEAVIRLGIETDTFDAEGRMAAPVSAGPWPDRADIDRALDAFRGTFLQEPPVFSAKKVAGRRSHRVARARQAAGGTDSVAAAAAPTPAPVRVTTDAIEILGVDGDRVTLRIDCSAGFYVRSLAHDLGRRLGIGGHLAALRRTRSGVFTLADAVQLETLDAEAARAALVPVGRMLPHLAAVHLTEEGALRARHGRPIARLHAVTWAEPPAGGCVRLLGPDGDLLGLAEPTSAPDLLHPAVVLM